ncbi:unnamed protein product [Phytophthora fragariaefolia]|uniref:MORN repeat-containing protein 5 n=1 Tax=Phytophthora fragariaefolia TaxID=1490495 RepID=A0A9W6XLE3_9STRA|nr:unnamed protein product [Phytophthora fragariaefolia]
MEYSQSKVNTASFCSAGRRTYQVFVQYEGAMEFGRYHGKGVLHLPDGYRYEGEFQNGEFHGRGTLFFPEGKLEGEWVCGKYAPTGWAYCTNSNRQYYSESVSPRGILPTGELNYFDTGVNRVIPLGSYDAGNGIYTPSTGLVSAYNNPSETREPTEQEKEWIVKRAPKATTKDMSIH